MFVGKKFDETKFVALPLFLWWYITQENFCKDKGNLFYVSITFWMMLMCKKIVWILKNPLILFENSGKNEFNFSFSQRMKCPLRWSMNNKEISSLILVDNSNFDLNRKSSKTNSQHDYPILSLPSPPLFKTRTDSFEIYFQY